MEIVESSSSCVDVPPGFRFHPTEEELVGYYLNRKINSLKIDLDVIVHIDLYRIEPWDIQGSCNLGYDEQKEWYFFSHKDRKYPTGTRTNRATAAGFWKATGRDKAVFSKDNKLVIGMRKTLVYYKGRAPNGRKSDWIMHEYRLHTSDQHQPPQEEGWVVCRAFKKPSSISQQKQLGCWNNNNTILINHHHQQQQSSPLLSSNIIYEQDQMVDLIPNLHDHSLSISGFTGFPSTNDGFDQDLIHGDHQREFLVIDGDHDTQLIDESGQVMAADSCYSSFPQFQNTPFIDRTHN